MRGGGGEGHPQPAITQTHPLFLFPATSGEALRLATCPLHPESPGAESAGVHSAEGTAGAGTGGH